MKPLLTRGSEVAVTHGVAGTPVQGTDSLMVAVR
jgi:hypothetical protein